MQCEESDLTHVGAVVSTIGSCACFTLSRLIGRALARAIWPDQLAKYAQEVISRVF